MNFAIPPQRTGRSRVPEGGLPFPGAGETRPAAKKRYLRFSPSSETVYSLCASSYLTVYETG
jgi:hypothetical protein